MVSHLYTHSRGRRGRKYTALTQETGRTLSCPTPTSNCVPGHIRAHTFAPAVHTPSRCDGHGPPTGRPAHAQSHQARTRAAGTRTPARPRTRTGSHTPAFPVPACFSGNSALRSPPPRPEVLAVFLASLVSAPSLLLLPAQDLPPCTPRGTPAIPFPTVIPEGIPGRRWGHGFSRWLRGERGGGLP